MVWVVATHMCGGSMGEAAGATAAFGYRSEKSAKDFAGALEAELNRVHGDWFVDCFELPMVADLQLPQASAAQVNAAGLGPVPEGHVALDIGKIAEKVAEYEEFERLPPAPEEDEIQAAIASITGGS